jgi:hypothetical protein
MQPTSYKSVTNPPQAGPISYEVGRAARKGTSDFKNLGKTGAKIFEWIENVKLTSFRAGLGMCSATSIAPAVLEVESGLLMLNLANETNNGVQRLFAAFKIAIGVMKLLYKAEKTSCYVFTLVNIHACNAGLKALIAVLKTVGGIGAAVLYTLMSIPQCIKASKADKVLRQLNPNNPSALLDLYNHCSGEIELQTWNSNVPTQVDNCNDFQGKLIKKEHKFSTITLAELKVVAPRTFDRLKSGERGPQLIKAARKECKKKIIETTVITAISALMAIFIGSTMAVAGGTILLVRTIVLLTFAAIKSVKDGASLIRTLKKTDMMSKRDLLINTITIAIIVTSIVLACVFATSPAMMIASIVMGVVLLALPIGTIAYMKIKQKKFEDAYYDKLLQEDIRIIRERRYRKEVREMLAADRDRLELVQKAQFSKKIELLQW